MTVASLTLSRYPLGLRLFTHDLRRPLLTTLTLAALLGALTSIADLFFFTAALPPAYVQLVHDLGTIPRIVFIGGKSILDEVVYRLGVMTLLVWAASLLRRPGSATYWGAIILAQLINIALNGPAPATPLEVAFCLIRVELPGMLFGYLYWRHGFATAALTHAASHCVVQPVFTLFL